VEAIRYSLAEIELIVCCASELLASEAPIATSLLRHLVDMFDSDFVAIASLDAIMPDKVDFLFHYNRPSRDFDTSLIQHSIDLIRKKAAASERVLISDNRNTLLSLQQDAQGQITALILQRTQRKFDSKSAASLELLHTVVRRRLAGSFQPARNETQPMSKRLTQVLEGMLEGLSEKQIASSLQISFNTVHVYVKDIYRRHKVNSRAELLSKLLRSNGSIEKLPADIRSPIGLNEIPRRDVNQTFQYIPSINPIPTVACAMPDMVMGQSQPARKHGNPLVQRKDILLAIGPRH
jgi:DNA-binding CsgD family transcriptional regulator